MSSVMESLVKEMVKAYFELENSTEKMSARLSGCPCKEEEEYLDLLEKEVNKLDAALTALCPEWYELYASEEVA